MSEPQFFNPFAEILQHKNNLPHWQQPGATYFITFHLADSIPSTLLDQWNSERSAWLKRHPQPWNREAEREYHERFSRQIDLWLDAGHGACWLRSPELRAPLADTFRHGDERRYLMHAWVIMPNHAHVLVSLHTSSKLENEIGAWKSISARGINQHLSRQGTVWQEDYFDRIIRDTDHFLNCARYIRRNPEKARLRVDEYELYESDFLRDFEA